MTWDTIIGFVGWHPLTLGELFQYVEMMRVLHEQLEIFDDAFNSQGPQDFKDNAKVLRQSAWN